MKFDATPYINSGFTIDNQFLQQVFIEAPFKHLFGKFNEKTVSLVLDVTAQEITDRYKELLESQLSDFHQTATEYATYLKEYPEETQRFATFPGTTDYERVYSNIMMAHRNSVRNPMIEWTLSHVTVPLKEKTYPEFEVTYLRLLDQLKSVETTSEESENEMEAEPVLETPDVHSKTPPSSPTGN